MRIYTAKVNQKFIVILLGGNKNGQNKDIKKAKKILKKSKPLILLEHRPEEYDFKKPELVREILAECILNGDYETFQDVLISYIKSYSKTKLANKTKLGRQTLYDLLDEKKEFNPEWQKLKIILKAI